MESFYYPDVGEQYHWAGHFGVCPPPTPFKLTAQSSSALPTLPLLLQSTDPPVFSFLLNNFSLLYLEWRNFCVNLSFFLQQLSSFF